MPLNWKYPIFNL